MYSRTPVAEPLVVSSERVLAARPRFDSAAGPSLDNGLSTALHFPPFFILSYRRCRRRQGLGVLCWPQICACCSAVSTQTWDRETNNKL